MQSINVAKPFRTAVTSIISPLRTKQRHPPNQHLWSLTTSRFLSLPTEIRIQIYQLVFTDSEIYFREVRTEGRWREKVDFVFSTPTSNAWSILLTCRACYHEARALYIQMTSFALLSAYNKYTVGYSLPRFTKHTSDFARKHLIEIREKPDFTTEVQISSIGGIKEGLPIQDNLKYLTNFPNLQRFIFKRDLRTEWPPERRWLRDFYESGPMTADVAQQILAALCLSPRFLNLMKFIRPWGQDTRHSLADRIDFLCEISVRHSNRPLPARPHSRHMNPSTLVGVCFANLSNKSFYFDAGGLLGVTEGFQHVVRAQTRSGPGETSDTSTLR